MEAFEGCLTCWQRLETACFTSGVGMQNAARRARFRPEAALGCLTLRISAAFFAARHALIAVGRRNPFTEWRDSGYAIPGTALPGKTSRKQTDRMQLPGIGGKPENYSGHLIFLPTPIGCRFGVLPNMAGEDWMFGMREALGGKERLAAKRGTKGLPKYSVPLALFA